jgi:hypothetical protein
MVLVLLNWLALVQDRFREAQEVSWNSNTVVRQFAKYFQNQGKRRKEITKWIDYDCRVNLVLH